MPQKILKTGNSLAVVVPADFIKNIGAKAGDSVRVFPKPEKGEVLYKFSGAMQLPLSENFLSRKKTRKTNLRG
ncbi:AbrB/MazE/SpoVT family DNA-binding domain-containing protein [Candidatus Gottesmanbacteria bacterium]|nr:AbrB/MazE/SpoVT family DNA-binding domain-containing protein [Candidatus Gottesmanbacteria bacterium]